MLSQSLRTLLVTEPFCTTASTVLGLTLIIGRKTWEPAAKQGGAKQGVYGEGPLGISCLVVERALRRCTSDVVVQVVVLHAPALQKVRTTATLSIRLLATHVIFTRLSMPEERKEIGSTGEQTNLISYSVTIRASASLFLASRSFYIEGARFPLPQLT